MLRLLLSLSSLEDPKILVLTYKNHALDEFLKGIMRYVDKERVVRLGGRCRDPELNSISLGEHKKTASKHPEFRNQLNALYANIDDSKAEIEEQFRNLNKLRKYSYEMLLDGLKPEQMISLLLGCDWDAMNVMLNFGGEIDADGFAKQKNKGGNAKKTRITKQKVHDILNSGKFEEYNESFLKLQKEALRKWLPSDEFESQLIGTKTKSIQLKVLNPKEANDLKKKKQADDEEEEKGIYNLEDEKEIEEEQRERMSALTKADFSVKSDFNKTLIRVDYGEEKEGEKESNIKAFSSAALLKIEDMVSGVLLMENDIWSLPVEERIRFTQVLIAKATHSVREGFQEKLRAYEDTCKQKMEIENQHVANILQKKQVIGVTITGASINQQLLKQVQPEIVIVEEAAEVNIITPHLAHIFAV